MNIILYEFNEEDYHVQIYASNLQKTCVKVEDKRNKNRDMT